MQYSVQTPIKGVHAAWIVNGKRIRLVDPKQVLPGAKLIIGLREREDNELSIVHAIIEVTIDGNMGYNIIRARVDDGEK